MADITSPKVAIPTALFALLSPGLVLELPSGGFKLATGNTTMQAVATHLLVFLVVFRLIAQMMGLVLKPNDMLVAGFLFVLLSPGVLLTIPGAKGMVDFRSGKTSVCAILVHTVVYAIVFALLRKTFPQFY